MLLSACVFNGPQVDRKVRPAPLPYRFQITSFTDERELKADTLPFHQEDFLYLLQNKMAYGLFSNTPARLRLKLHRYQFSHFQQDFTLSMAIHMEALSNLDKELINKEITCTVDHFGGVADVVEFAKNAHKQPEIFTKEGWQARIEKELLDECVQQIVTNFSREVVRSTPVKGGW
ncbi:MAG: hypothetical protein OXR68_02225 [Alphaproteobacteria bacterium]|nr:hypothetical protein [Alphaproteobacteria bacterium]MDD9919427.1 hypothetical protein [Alphaproteobacteria bacterium]